MNKPPELNDTELLSYARITLSDWKTLANLVSKHTLLVKDLARDSKEKKSDTRILSQRQITDALHGPLHEFFKQKMIAYATITRVRLELTVSKEELFKENRKQPEKYQLNKKSLENFTVSDINDIQTKLNELTENHYEQWEEKIKAWQHNLLKKLEALEIILSITEIQEFLGREPISELVDRFTDLKIEYPKTKKHGMNYSIYFTYKSNIIISSALSRQHLPHEQSDINKILKKMKADFDAIYTEENELIKKQALETEEVLDPLAFAKFPKS